MTDTTALSTVVKLVNRIQSEGVAARFRYASQLAPPPVPIRRLTRLQALQNYNQGLVAPQVGSAKSLNPYSPCSKVPGYRVNAAADKAHRPPLTGVQPFIEPRT